ncbi:ribosomal L5P family protein [Xylariales sp. PMI_506]|nr:ribosomal L5P family protein [Xylariales sp. PMI_506]
MTVLREVSRSSRPFLKPSAAWKSCGQSFSRSVSTNAAPATASSPTNSAPIHPDIEASSGLNAPIVDKESAVILGPKKRASRRPQELPHGRYRFHSPKYYRGPLHPVQPLPSSDPVARNFSPGPFNLPRLRQTFHSTLSSDIMTLAYHHKLPNTPDKPERIRLRSWGDDTPYMANRPKRGPRGAEVLLPLEEHITYRNIPEIRAVHIAMYMPEARKNQDHIVVGKAILQSITGAKPVATENKHSVAQWNVIKGHRTGVKVSIMGNQAYEFLDKMIHLVFPKIKEWKGVKGSTGDGAGNLAWGLESSHMMYFPEVEANYSMYPSKMISGCRIFVETTAKSDRHARLLLQSMGVPFHGKLID